VSVWGCRSRRDVVLPTSSVSATPCRSAVSSRRCGVYWVEWDRMRSRACVQDRCISHTVSAARARRDPPDLPLPSRPLELWGERISCREQPVASDAMALLKPRVTPTAAASPAGDRLRRRRAHMHAHGHAIVVADLPERVPVSRVDAGQLQRVGNPRRLIYLSLVRPRSALRIGRPPPPAGRPQRNACPERDVVAAGGGAPAPRPSSLVGLPRRPAQLLVLASWQGLGRRSGERQERHRPVGCSVVELEVLISRSQQPLRHVVVTLMAVIASSLGRGIACCLC